MRPTYHVHIWQEDDLWIARVASADAGTDPTPIGAITDATTHDEIQPMARDLIATLLDAEESTFNVTFQYPHAPASQPGFRATKGFGYVAMQPDSGSS